MSAHSKGPTLELMHRVWLRRNRARWPATFQEAMEHPIFSRLLKIRALYCELGELSPVMKRGITPPEASPPEPPPDAPKTGFWMDVEPRTLDP